MTAAAAHAALVSDLTTATIVHSPTVYDHEPREIEHLAVTVTFAGMSPEFWRYFVRLYVVADPEQQQKVVMETVPSIEAALGDTFGPSNWTVGYRDDLGGAYVAEWPVEAGREDF